MKADADVNLTLDTLLDRSLPLTGGARSTNGRGKSGVPYYEQGRGKADVRYYEHGVEIPAEVGRASLIAQLERYARDVGLGAAALQELKRRYVK